MQSIGMINGFHYCITVFFILFAAQIAAQNPRRADLAPCAAPDGILPWLKTYAPGHSRSEDTLYVGMQVHLVGKNDGTGHFPPSFLLDAFCQLNADFQVSRIRFYFKNDWHYIQNDAWRQHSAIPTGIEMMEANNVPDALNAYVVSNPAGACGYNLPYAGIALANGCLLDGDHTWAHEAGHALSLPHTFLGWEGTLYNFNMPTPLELTFDYTYFHETPDTLIPAPLDTALVEYADFSNCTAASDLFCDTPPDYLSISWPCDANGFSLTKQKDPSGIEFYSDGTLFMSYAAPQCQNRFSDEQTAAMRAFLQEEKASWLSSGPSAANVSGVPELLTPTGGQPAPAVNPVLQWQPALHATHYVVQVSTNPDFAPLVYEKVSVATFHTVSTSLTPGATCYWRVRPFNAWDACAGWSQTETFVATMASSEEEPGDTGWRCYPTVLTSGQSFTVEFGQAWQQKPVDCTVYDATGSIRWETLIPAPSGRHRIVLPSAGWTPGLHVIAMRGEAGVQTQKILVTR